MTVNGKATTYAAASDKHYRWPGYYSLLNDANPQGNVLVLNNQKGTSLNLHVAGSGLAGVQVCETK